ncbi:MAG: ribbon-helix-helix domain-containing protein [Candidatus Thorarchaeota archaeon]
MVRGKTIQKNIRIPEKMWERCQELIDQGEFATDTELVRAALRELLKKYEKKQERAE